MSSAGRVGDHAKCPDCGHGKSCCVHSVDGPATAGSPDVFVNGMAAMRVNDPGRHSGCCGPNTWQATKGSTGVFINGQAAHRMGDETTHCGGKGQLAAGSPDTTFGDMGGGAPKAILHDKTVSVVAHDAMGRSIQNCVARITCPHKEYPEVKFSGTASLSGLCTSASVVVSKALQKGEWDPGAHQGTAVAFSHHVD